VFETWDLQACGGPQQRCVFSYLTFLEMEGNSQAKVRIRMAHASPASNPMELLARKNKRLIGSVELSSTEIVVGAVCEIDPLQDPRWDEFVKRHRKGSVFHTTQWLSALRRVYGYDPLLVSIGPTHGELSSNMLCCGVKSFFTGCRYVSLPFSDHCDPLVENAEEFDHLLMHLKHGVDEGDWQYLEVRPTTFQPGTATQLAKSDTYYYHRLDLERNIELLFRGFHKDCIQRKIRRAEREKLRYEEGRSEVLLKKFYRLMVMTRRRQGLPPQPIAWFRGLIASFDDCLKIRVASKGDTPVASILTLSYKNCMTYKYGCSDARFNNLGGTPFLFWKTIEEAKCNGLEVLDLGRSDVDNPGLVTFKEHWGASRSVLNYWRYPAKNQANPRPWKARLGHWMASRSPAWALKAAGNLLYPHIG